METQRLNCFCTSFSYLHSRLHENNENGRASGNLLFASEDNVNNSWFLLHRFQKFAFSVKNDPSARQRYHCNNIVFKSFHFGERFQKLSFSVKTIISVDRFRVDAR